MARRMIKFPLKMKNGAEVRSLEELQANADVESIMKYYFSGQLSLWCRAFGYENIPAGITKINESFVNAVMQWLGINASAEEMQEYIKNSFGAVDTSKITEDIENEEEIIDNTGIKNILKKYTNRNLDDYKISVVSVENENGRIEKYRVSVACEKTEQYYHFVLPYNVYGDYKKEHFVDDFYKKILQSIIDIQENNEYNGLKNSRFAALEVGDTFEFGKYDGEPIKWIVLNRFNENTIYVLSKKILCERAFDYGDWENSEIREWLNNDFYNSAFSVGEKFFINDIYGDKITLLSNDEFEKFITTNSMRDVGKWWLRSHNCVTIDGGISSLGLFCSVSGVRPAFYLKF